jgi:ectoine hydroxylase-related dioxygenase (phytanoyl-CoA dioxygenase family)
MKDDNAKRLHGAGTNRSKDVRRIANLLQVSSAFGRAMESVDRLKMSLRLYPALKGLLADKTISAAEAENAIAASAEAIPSRPTSTPIR